MATKLRTIPVRAISEMRIRWLPKTTALGGVATGIMKAIDAEIVAGIAKSNGWTCKLTAQLARIGRSMESVATLDVSSVKNVILKQMTTTRIKTGTGPKALKRLPI